MVTSMEMRELTGAFGSGKGVRKKKAERVCVRTHRDVRREERRRVERHCLWRRWKSLIGGS